MSHQVANLKMLYLGQNSLTGNLPDSISNASKLISLDLFDNNFSGIIPDSLGNLGLLEYLNLGDNNFISEPSSPELSFIASLTNCKKLRVLSIRGNPITGTLPVSIGNLSVSLREFYAYICNIRGPIPNEIGNLSGLITLSLFGNDLSGSIPNTIKCMRKLQQIGFDDNMLRGSIPDDFCQLPNLRGLYLSYNQLSGSVPACLWNISSLRHLYLRSNKLTSTIPASLGNFKDLLKFDASLNSLQGRLPSEIGSLRAVILLNISYNNLSGDIPGSIGDLQNLVKLYLEHNDLIGAIPETFRSLLSLEILDLSHNNLSGTIPKSLDELLYLKYFNVSYNKLYGAIPSGGPFGSFTSQSFFPNGALCEYGLGGSVSRSCDVYSYGIMLMETFTGKKPTDEMFAGHMTLKCWVKESLRSGVIQVLDRNLLRQDGENSLAAVNCVSSILMLAVDCAAESPEQRIDMKDVLATLKKIKACRELKVLPFRANPLNGIIPVSAGNLSTSLEQIAAGGCGILEPFL
ncbi:hypothetical protein RJ640_002754, partial [Escallonia rubra]